MYESGADDGKFYSLNVPLKDGIDDQGKESSTKYFRPPQQILSIEIQILPPNLSDKPFASCQCCLLSKLPIPANTYSIFY